MPIFLAWKATVAHLQGLLLRATAMPAHSGITAAPRAVRQARRRAPGAPGARAESTEAPCAAGTAGPGEATKLSAMAGGEWKQLRRLSGSPMSTDYYGLVVGGIKPTAKYSSVNDYNLIPINRASLDGSNIILGQKLVGLAHVVNQRPPIAWSRPHPPAAPRA